MGAKIISSHKQVLLPLSKICGANNFEGIELITLDSATQLNYFNEYKSYIEKFGVFDLNLWLSSNSNRKIYIYRNEENECVAGICLCESFLEKVMYFKKLPSIIHFLNKFMKIINKKGEIRYLKVDAVWCHPNYSKEFNILLSYLKRKYQNQASVMLVKIIDQQMQQYFRSKPWNPSTKVHHVEF